MDFGLKDKVIFIAGASRGIGYGIAESLLGEGAKVALTARGAESLDVTKAELAKRFGKDKVWSFAGDLTQTAPIEAALAASGWTKQLVRNRASEFSPHGEGGRPSRTARVSSRASAGSATRGSVFFGGFISVLDPRRAAQADHARDPLLLRVGRGGRPRGARAPRRRCRR